MGYEKDTLKSYVDAMLQASDIIKKQNPDYIIAPMAGSIPFIDAMALLDKDFDSSKVVYMPASSRIRDVNAIIRDWYSNFLKDVIPTTQYFPKIMGIDEVVSGQSVVRCFKEVDTASQKKRKEIRQGLVERLHDSDKTVSLQAIGEADSMTNNVYSQEFGGIRGRITGGNYRSNSGQAREDSRIFVNLVRDHLENKLVYTTVGIEDSKKPNRSRDYNTLREAQRVLPVSIKNILTMDTPNYSTVQFTPLENVKGEKHIVQFSPVVQKFEVTPEYMDFLTSLANLVGRNPNDVAPVNMRAILDSKKYLPQVFTGREPQTDLFK